MSSKQDYPCLWNGQGTRGLALILNYEFEKAKKEDQRTGSEKDMEDLKKAEELAPRIGSEKDVEYLEKVLKNLSYEVEVGKNLTMKGTKWALDDFVENSTHKESTTDSTIVVVMSHGMAGEDRTGSKFFTEDNGQMGTQEVVDRLQKISGLKGKPKICFFNMCRDTAEEEKSGPPERNRLQVKYEKPLQKQEDTLIVYSTLPRDSSHRFNKTGSVFIQNLCTKLADRTQVAHKDLECLLKEIVEDMRNERIEVKDSKHAERQIPEILNRAFTRQFYFFSHHTLRMHYLDHVCKVVPLPWCDALNWSVDEIYTELVIEGREREPFGVEQLFTHAKLKNVGCYRIIIEGDPGYGKSTLTLKMASDWSKQSPARNYMNQFRYCLLVTLGRIGENGDMEKFLVDYFQDMLEADMNTLLKGKNGQKPLVILDGFDEANSETKKFVCTIMRCERWNQCHVVLTSRFGYINSDVKKHAMCTSVRGFKKKQVAVAVGKFFIKAGHITKDEAVSHSLKQTTLEDFCDVEKGSLSKGRERVAPHHIENFIENLTQEDPYEDLARCPLLCAMLCCLMKDDPERDLPKTLAGLYFAVINRNLYRALKREASNCNENASIWKLDEFKDKFHTDHEKYLFDFGSLCLDYIQGKPSSFSLYEIVGNKQEAKLEDPKVTRLLAAGVIIQNFEDGKETLYLPTHRSMAEFLAAYRLTKEENEENVTDQLLKLYADKSSFSQIFTFVVDLKCGHIFAKAFHDIKLPKNFVYLFRNKSLENKKNLSEMMTALPGTLELPNLGIVHPTFVEEIFRANSSLRFLELEYRVFQKKFKLESILFHLLKSSYSLEFRHFRIKILNPSQKDQPRSPSLSWEGSKGFLDDSKMDNTKMFNLLIQDLIRFKIRLSHLKMTCIKWFYDTSLIQDLFLSLQELSHSDVCPDSIAVYIDGADVACWELLKNLPSKCSLAELDLRVVIGSTGESGHEQLDFIVNNLLPDRLTKLSLRLTQDGSVGWESPLLRVKPWISKIMSSEKLTHLCLDMFGIANENMNAEYLIDGILASKLEELKLMNIIFKLKSNDLTRWASVTRCRLRRVHLESVEVDIEDPSCFSWNNISFPLEELTLRNCHALERLLASHGSPFDSLRVLTVEGVGSTSILDFITVLFERNTKTLTKFTIGSSAMFDLDMEKLFGELFKHCQELETVTMHFRVRKFSELEAILKAAFSNLPNLQTLEFPRVFNSPKGEYIRSVFEAIADRARQWPGKEAANSSLTLSNIRMEWPVHAALVFRERKLNYKIKYIEDDTYEIWFPPTMVDHQPARRQQTNNNAPNLRLWDRFCKII